MKREIPIRNRRIGVIINYFCIIIIVLLIEGGEKWMGLIAPLLITGTISALIAGVISFIYVYWRTSLWKLIHSSFDKLDERQIQVIYNSLRYSYSIFAIICLVILYINAVTERGPGGVITAGCLLYFAHILPASIIAWTEREVLIGC